MEQPKIKRPKRLTHSPFSYEMFAKIRKKHNIPVKQLSLNQANKLIGELNQEVSNWILNNPEGFKLPDMGYLIVSKRQNKPYFQDVDAVFKKIDDEMRLSDLRKSILKSRYKFKNERHDLKYHQYTPYIYKVMWFNKKNCFSRKCEAYFFEPFLSVKKKLKDIIKSGSVNYTNHNFHEYYMPYFKYNE